MIFMERFQLFGLLHSSMSVSLHPLLLLQITVNFTFKLFSEKNQRQLAHALGSLLSPKNGSIIFGCHVALPTQGILTEISDKDVKMFCHDPDSWEEMWVGRSIAQGSTGVDHADSVGGFSAPIFPPNTVNLNSRLIQVRSDSGESQAWLLIWSITRL